MRKFCMSVSGVRATDGGVCDECHAKRTVAYVHPLERLLCSSCLSGEPDGRGRPKESWRDSAEADKEWDPDTISPEDKEWMKQNFPEAYAAQFGRPVGGEGQELPPAAPGPA